MFDSTSAAEKVGMLGLLGGIIVAGVKSVRWVANFSEEHRLLLENLKRVEPALDDIAMLKEAVANAKEERKEIITELRGLRQEIHNVLTLMIQGSQKRG